MKVSSRRISPASSATRRSLRDKKKFVTTTTTTTNGRQLPSSDTTTPRSSNVFRKTQQQVMMDDQSGSSIRSSSSSIRSSSSSRNNSGFLADDSLDRSTKPTTRRRVRDTKKVGTSATAKGRQLTSGAVTPSKSSDGIRKQQQQRETLVTRRRIREKKKTAAAIPTTTATTTMSGRHRLSADTSNKNATTTDDNTERSIDPEGGKVLTDYSIESLRRFRERKKFVSHPHVTTSRPQSSPDATTTAATTTSTNSRDGIRQQQKTLDDHSIRSSGSHVSRVLTDDSLERSIQPEIKQITRNIENELQGFESFLKELINREDVLNGFTHYIHAQQQQNNQDTNHSEDNKEDLVEDFLIDISSRGELRDALLQQLDQQHMNNNSNNNNNNKKKTTIAAKRKNNKDTSSADSSDDSSDFEDEGKEVAVDELIAPLQAKVRGFLARRRCSRLSLDNTNRYSIGSIFSMIDSVARDYHDGGGKESRAASAVAMVMRAAFNGYDVDAAAVVIQALGRGFLTRRRLRSSCVDDAVRNSSIRNDDDGENDNDSVEDDSDDFEDEGVSLPVDETVVPLQAMVRGYLIRRNERRICRHCGKAKIRNRPCPHCGDRRSSRLLALGS